MSVPASAIRKMVKFGLTAEQIAELCEDIQGAVDTSEKRRTWDREYRRRKRESGGMSGGMSGGQAVAESGGNRVEIHPTPRARVRDNPSLFEISGLKEERKETSLCSAKKNSPPRLKTRRVPIAWMPDRAALAAAAPEFTPGEIEREIAKMRDHEYASPRSDWDAAARNWLRTAAERRPTNGRQLAKPQQLVVVGQDAFGEVTVDINSRGIMGQRAASLAGRRAAEDWEREHGGDPPSDSTGYPRIA